MEDLSILLPGVIYGLFFIMSALYFWIFRSHRLMVHLYCSMIPLFICVYLVINYNHYEPVEGLQQLISLSLLAVCLLAVYWLIFLLRNRNK